MTEQNSTPENNESDMADALAVTALIAVVVGCVAFWLAGMPG